MTEKCQRIGNWALGIGQWARGKGKGERKKGEGGQSYLKLAKIFKITS
jgi:hypothetical protein